MKKFVLYLNLFITIIIFDVIYIYEEEKTKRKPSLPIHPLNLSAQRQEFLLKNLQFTSKFNEKKNGQNKEMRMFSRHTRLLFHQECPPVFQLLFHLQRQNN